MSLALVRTQGLCRLLPPVTRCELCKGLLPSPDWGLVPTGVRDMTRARHTAKACLGIPEEPVEGMCVHVIVAIRVKRVILGARVTLVVGVRCVRTKML